ncbi:MAG: hypothetical protein JRH15_22385, partial [Deltaproteobacteria bacterium]|nr:hypothetical protein [Deltaproteobacteria bacterium]
MRKKIKKLGLVCAIFTLASCFLFLSASFAEKPLPQPGEVIDQNNYEKYAHLFGEGFLEGFKSGFGGFRSPISIKVSATVDRRQSKRWMELSEKNRGKFSINSEGNLVGDWEHLAGFPFPEIYG